MTETDRGGRRAVVAIVVAVLVTAGAAAAVLLPRGEQRRSVPPPAYDTVPVVKGKVSKETIVTGSLQFARPRTITAGLSGVVTGLPAVGAQAGFGQALYLVDQQPVFLLQGTVPMWRDFERRMSGGPDVQQLEAGLQAMGYFSGTVDETFTAYTLDAIKRLQRALGERPTGRLLRGTILFGDRTFRVAARRTTLGDEIAAGDDVLAVSSDQKVVHADVKLADERLTTRGAAVTVVLPGGGSARGRVAGVGPAVEKRQADGNSTAVVVPTTIALEDQRQVRRFQRASVSVRFASALRRDVLSVPVEALVALSDTRFGVEVPAPGGGSRRVPVRTGLFAAGRVEISGHGIRKGLRVVVPRR